MSVVLVIGSPSRASGRGALGAAFVGYRGYAAGAVATDAASSGAADAVDLLDGSKGLRAGSLDLASNDQLTAAPDHEVTVPESKRYAGWGRQYLMLVAAADAVVGGLALRPERRPAAALLGWPGRLAGCNRFVPRISPKPDRYRLR